MVTAKEEHDHPNIEKGTKYPATNPSTLVTANMTTLLGFFAGFDADFGIAL